MVTWVKIFLIVYQQFVIVWNNSEAPCNSNSLVELLVPSISFATVGSHHITFSPTTTTTTTIFPQQRHKTDNELHQIFLPLRLLDICVPLISKKIYIYIAGAEGDRKHSHTRRLLPTVAPHWHSFIHVNNKCVRNTYCVPYTVVLGGDEGSTRLCFQHSRAEDTKESSHHGDGK